MDSISPVFELEHYMPSKKTPDKIISITPLWPHNLKMESAEKVFQKNGCKGQLMFSCFGGIQFPRVLDTKFKTSDCLQQLFEKDNISSTVKFQTRLSPQALTFWTVFDRFELYFKKSNASISLAMPWIN